MFKRALYRVRACVKKQARVSSRDVYSTGADSTYIRGRGDSGNGGRCRGEYGKEAEVVLRSILIDANQRRSRLAHAQQQGQKNMEVCSEIHHIGMVAFQTSFEAYPSLANVAIRSGGCSISIKSKNQESMMCATCRNAPSHILQSEI